MTRTAARRQTLWTPAFTAVTLAATAYFTADGVLIPAVPRLVAGPLGAGNVAVGLTVGAFSVSAFLLRPWAGRAGDRWGRRPLMLAGSALFMVSVLGYGLAGSPGVLAALRLLTGAGEALFFVGAITTVTDLAPAERRGTAMSLASLSLYVGVGLGPVLGEAAIDRFGFGAAWALAAGLGLGALVLAARVPETRPDSADVPGPLVHRAGLAPGVVLLAGLTGMAGFLAFVPLYARDLGLAGSGGVLLLFGGLIVAIRSIGASLPDRLGAERGARLSMMLSAAGLAVMGTWRAPAGLVTGTVLLAAGIALLAPALLTLAVERVEPRERGSVIGTTSAFIDLAFGLGPASLGIVAAAAGRPWAFLAGAAVAGAGLALLTRPGSARTAW
jgi:MFS family permease